MFLRRFYYSLKPILPRRLRYPMRRWLAARTRSKVQDIWPILEAAGTPPDGWPGWPNGKKFAVVLTHDVEGQEGLDRIPALMELEAKMGFRSCFNLIPEGSYTVPFALRSMLRDNGFEVGVHDLYHDGKLYRSRQHFRACAQHINRHLKDWDAAGFRSGFMHHHLDWLHDLNIQYDCSTFDTDPFEPQPDGVGTIFPFWVPAPSGSLPYALSSTPSAGSSSGSLPYALRPKLGSGYVELPYTLPQDSTLFLFLGETSIDLWKKKLDWIVAKGGMALVNVHPDYMALGSGTTQRGAYPASEYRQFLDYIKSKYSDSYWSALPGEVATFASQLRLPHKSTRKRRICMLSYSFYQTDNRVMRYAQTLAKQGDHVDVFALKTDDQTTNPTTLNGVTVYGLQHRRHDEKGKHSYLARISRFCLRSSYLLAKKHLKQRYDLVHVHNVPDFLVFAAWFPKLFGAKLILDIHDIVPEFYCSKFNVPENSPTIRRLKKVERLSTNFANHVIISNHLWYDKITARSIAKSRCTPFANYVDPAVFYPRKKTRSDGKFIIIFPGGLQWHQGLDIAIRAFGQIKEEVTNAEFHIYGEGNMKAAWVSLCQDLKLNGTVKFFESRPLYQIADIMANADLGVVPKRADSFGNEAYSTKIMEFMSLGVPVVVSRTKIDSYYFTDSVVKFFESGNVNELAETLLTVIRDPALRNRMIQNAFGYVASNNWDVKKHEYLELVDRLVGSLSP